MGTTILIVVERKQVAEVCGVGYAGDAKFLIPLTSLGPPADLTEVPEGPTGTIVSILILGKDYTKYSDTVSQCHAQTNKYHW